MNAPDFWQRGRGGLAARLLSPLSCLYGYAGKMRQSMTSPLKTAVPVLCVGNVVAGGAGKTPVALELGRRLRSAGMDFHYLSRGYGGSETGPHRVDPSADCSAKVGDEPLLLSEVAPTWVSKDRRFGAKAIIDAGGRAIVMDDGLQNPSLQKDLSVLVIDGRYGLGNGRLMPAGPLRESLTSALEKTNVVVLMGEDQAGIATQVHQIASHIPILRATLIADRSALDLANRPVHAFAGIGQPEKFFDTLRGLMIDLRSTMAFPDHHAFSDGELAALVKAAEADQALLLTTEKDYVRLDTSWRSKIEVLPVSLQWADEAEIDALLAPFIRLTS